LFQLVSHRVSFTYADGIVVIGYVKKVLPSDGEPFLVELTKAKVYRDSRLMATYAEFVVVFSIVSDYGIQEGPSADSKE